MNYKKLGNTDLDVSTICLGTMTWGEQNTQDEGFEQMDYALDQGVNFWDTAEIYSIPPREETFGSTEEIIGNWFEKTKKRNKVILATKVCGPMREYVRGGGNQFGKKNITEALEGSLRRLKTDYIDLYQLHWPERNTNFFGKLGYEHEEDGEWTKFEDILESLKKFIDQGKIRYVGLSNETPWGLAKFLEMQDEIKAVQHPALKQHPDHDQWKEYFKGASGLFAVEFIEKITDEAINVLANRLEIFGIGASWGGYSSLVSTMDVKESRNVQSSYVPKGPYLRIYTGSENIKDLVNDFENGLNEMRKFISK